MLDERQQGFDFRSKVKNVAHLCVIEGFDPKSIAGAKELLAQLVPDRERKHAAQMIHTIGAPLAISGENYLGIGSRFEVCGAEFLTQFNVVVDFAVVGNPIAGHVGHRLIAGGKIDDAQAPVGEPGEASQVLPGTLAIGSAMAQQLVHGADLPAEIWYLSRRQAQRSGYSAHGLFQLNIRCRCPYGSRLNPILSHIAESSFQLRPDGPGPGSPRLAFTAMQ